MYAEGIYQFEVTNQGFGESKNKGTPFFFLEGLPVSRKVDDGQEPVDEPHQRTITFYITEKTVDRVNGDLTSLGWPGGKLSSLDPSRRDHFSFVGSQIEVECYYKPDIKNPAQMYENWDLPFVASGPKESDPKVANKLDALYGKKLTAAKPKAKQESQQPQTVPADDGEPNDNGDIPF